MITPSHVKVVQIGGYPPPHGGVTIHVQELARRLQQRLVPCQVLCNAGPKCDETEPGVRRFCGSRPRQFLAMLGATCALRPEIVHVHVAYGANALPWAAAFAVIPRPGASLITVHSGLFPAIAGALRGAKRHIYGRCLDQFSVIVAVNPDIRDAVAELGVAREKIRVIPAYFPPAGSFRPPQDVAVAEMRKDCGVLAFTSGFMHRDWGILHAARALHAIRDLNPGLVVAHSGVTDPEYEAQVRAAVPDARRLLIYGELPHDRFLAVLAATDIYIRASLYDGDSLAVREALDLGKAVIASDCAARPAGCALFQTGSQESLDSALRSAVRQPRFDQARPDQQGSTELLELYADLLAGAGKTARMTAA